MRCGRVHGLFHIALLQNLPCVFARCAHTPAKQSALKLQPHRHGVVFLLAHPAAHLVPPEVMPSRCCTWCPTSWGNHVGLGKVAGRARRLLRVSCKSPGRCTPSGLRGSKTAPLLPAPCRRRWAWRRETAPVAPLVTPPPSRKTVCRHLPYPPARSIRSGPWCRLPVGRCGGLLHLRRHAAPTEQAQNRERLMPSTQPPSKRDHDGADADTAPTKHGHAAPPPLPRRSSTLSDSRLPSHFMLLLPAPRHHAGYGLDIRPSSRRSIRREGLIGKQQCARLPPLAGAG